MFIKISDIFRMKCNIQIYLSEVVGSVFSQNTSLVRVVVLGALQKSLFCVVYFTSRRLCCPILHNLYFGDALTTVHKSTGSLLLEHLQWLPYFGV